MRYVFIKIALDTADRSCCNTKFCGKPVLNEEIPVNKDQEKVSHMSKLVETMFILKLGVRL